MITPVTIRLAGKLDSTGLQRLAERDTRSVPAGTLLLAERDGMLQAALSLETGESIADPFAPTEHLVELLRVYA